MKRDMELVRKILLEVEKENDVTTRKSINIDGYADKVLFHHLWLLDDGGFIIAYQGDISKRPHLYYSKAICLTWKGHEFLDAARDEGRWKKALEIVKQKVGSASFTVFTQLLARLALQEIER